MAKAAEVTELSGLVEPYLAERVRLREFDPTTARRNRSVLYGFVALGPPRPEQITRRHVERWLETKGHLRASTRRTQFSMVRVFLDWLVRNGRLASNPTRDMQAPRQPKRAPRALGDDSTGKLLARAPDARARAILMLMLGMGLRCVEVANLTFDDWNRFDQLMRVRGKGGHERELPVPTEVVRALEDYLREKPASKGRIIRSYLNPYQGVGADHISNMVSNWMNEAGLKQVRWDGVSAHALRHTAASDVLEKCHDLRVVQQMLGHEHLSTTSIYLRRAAVAQMREAMAGRDYALVST